MSGLARLLLSRGITVTGSDSRESPTTEELRREGAIIAVGHDAANVAGATTVVYTAAVQDDNPEVAAARAAGTETISRATMLARAMAGYRGIAIAGTHGKTTTTAMAAAVLLQGGLDPTVLVGGDWAPIHGNAYAGKGRHFLTEACEAFQSFLELTPDVALITNIEDDHLEFYGSGQALDTAFIQFLRNVRRDGYAVGAADDPRVRRAFEQAGCRHVTFGLSPAADYRAVEVDPQGRTTSFTLLACGTALGRIRLRVPGTHNVLNALGAAAIATEEGISFSDVASGLESFLGVGRRYETIGEFGGVRIVDDYAHHPTEIRVTLQAARKAETGKLIVLFQPHLYTRTELLLQEFALSFGDADHVLVADVYAARETPIPGVDGARLARAIQAASPGLCVEFHAGSDEISRRLAEVARPGDTVLTMGAGDVRRYGETLAGRLMAAAG